MPRALYNFELDFLFPQALVHVFHQFFLDDNRIGLAQYHIHLSQRYVFFTNVPSQNPPSLMLPMYWRVPNRTDESRHKAIMILNLPVHHRTNSAVRIAWQQGVVAGCIHWVPVARSLDFSVLDCFGLGLYTPRYIRASVQAFRYQAFDPRLGEETGCAVQKP